MKSTKRAPETRARNSRVHGADAPAHPLPPAAAGAPKKESTAMPTSQPMPTPTVRAAATQSVGVTAALALDRVLGVKLPGGVLLASIRDDLAAGSAPSSSRDFRLDEGASAGLELVRIARLPEVLTRLADLECQSWHCGAIERLDRLSSAALQLHTIARHAELHVVSPAVVEEAEGVKDRLGALLGHHFRKDATMMARAAGIDPGKTQIGLASALVDLHTLLSPHQAFLSHDQSCYRAEDFERALDLAKQITRLQSEPVRRDLAEVRRALRDELTLVFDEVRMAIAFVSFHWPRPPALPSLGALTERRRRRGAVEEAEDQGEDRGEDQGEDRDEDEATSGAGAEDADPGEDEASASTAEGPAAGAPTAAAAATPATEAPSAPTAAPSNDAGGGPTPATGTDG